MRKKLAGILLFAALTAYALSAPYPASTATTKSINVTVVTDTLDSNPGDGLCADANGNCSLRAAVMESNALPGLDTISIPKNTYELAVTGADEDASEKGDLDITDDLIIDGNQHYNTFVDGKIIDDRLFDIQDGAVVSITNVTIRSGDSSEDGGGIRNQGSLTLVDCSVSSNRTSDNGGGIYNGLNSKLILTNSAVSKNYSDNKGGGIYNFKGSVEVSTSTIGDNDSDTEGAGIYNDQGNIMVSASYITDNNAQNDNGGGIYNSSNANINLLHTEITGNKSDSNGGGISNSGSASLTKSTISGNESDYLGGGIFNRGSFSMTRSTANNNKADFGGGISNETGKLTLSNSTISGNLARHSGGGIYMHSGNLDVYNATIVDNRANIDWVGGHDGGGIKRTGGFVNLYNTIIALNVRVDINGFAIDDDCSGTLGNLSYSLLTTTTGCSFTSMGTTTGLNPKLGSLADNGGPTRTHALMDGSPAIDGGNPAGCKDQNGDPLTTDQRGYLRPFDGDENGSEFCDIGAYELVTYQPVSYLPFLIK